MTTPTLHMIGDAHLDPVWLWRWQEGFQAIKATMQSALDRLGETPAFVFTASSSAYFAWLEENAPALFDQVRAQVKAGRIALVGGWWVQPDCNLPGGESFVRQALFGQRYLREKFGVQATVGYNIDSFGHHAMLPQLLSGAGLDSYVFMRPKPEEKHLPGRLFWWESDDGSRVLAFQIAYEYTDLNVPLAHLITMNAHELREPFPERMVFYGIGNHGGGPTRAAIAAIEAGMQPGDAGEPAPALVFSTPAVFFARAREAERAGLVIPTVHDELQYHAPGAYAAHSGLKRLNRQAEHRLLTAEALLALAHTLVGASLPAERLNAAWRTVLFNQFHDILAGTSLEAACDDAQAAFHSALHTADEVINHAVQALSWAVPFTPLSATPEAETPVLVVNPHPWPVRALIELETDAAPLRVVVDHQGRPVPAQLVASHAFVTWRRRVAFMADLPALGWSRYQLIALPAEGAEPPTPLAPKMRETLDAARASAIADAPVVTTALTSADPWVLENDRFTLRFDPATGAIAELYDKAADFSLFTPGSPAALPVVYEDTSDTWGHGVTAYDRVLGTCTPTGARVLADGPVKRAVQIGYRWNRSVILQTFTLCAGLNRVLVDVDVNWDEPMRLVKLLFPFALWNAQATYEIPYGQIARPFDGREQPGGAWVDISGMRQSTQREQWEPFGVTVLNDGRYSFSASLPATLGMTLLRTPAYAHHDPARVSAEGGPVAWQDVGRHTFRYALMAHAGGFSVPGVAERAAAAARELNAPVIAQPESLHPGTLPERYAHIAVRAERGPRPAVQNGLHTAPVRASVVVSAIKRAEDGGGTIVRAHEVRGEAAQVTIVLGKTRHTAAFTPCQIRTFCFPDDDAPVFDVNLLEDRI